MADNQQTQLDQNDPWVAKARQLGTSVPTQAQPAQLDASDPWVAKAKQLQSGQAGPQQQLDPNDPWAVKARQLNPPQRSDAEAERMGEGQSFLFKPLTTSLLGLGEYRKGASPDTEYGKTVLGGVERGVEKFGTSLTSPFSIALVALTGGLGGVAEGAAAEGAELGAGTLAKAAINPFDSALGRLGGQSAQKWLATQSPEVAASAVKAAGTVSKLANAGFTGKQLYDMAKESPQLRDAIVAGDYSKAADIGMGLSLAGTFVGLSSYHLVKSFSPASEPVITKSQYIIAASEAELQRSGMEAHAFREANQKLIENKSLDLSARLYHEAGGDPSTLEQWRQEIADDNNIKPAIKDKYDAILKQAQTLPDEVKKLSGDLRVKYASEWDELKAIGKASEGSVGKENYSGQLKYTPNSDATLRNVGTRRLTKSPGFTKYATFDNIVDALKAGYEPKDIGLAGAREQYIRDLGGLRGAYAADQEALKHIHEADNRPVAIEPAKIVRVGKRELVPVKPGTDIGDVGERRATPRHAPMTASELDQAIKNRREITTPFDETEGARETMNRDLEAKGLGTLRNSRAQPEVNTQAATDWHEQARQMAIAKLGPKASLSEILQEAGRIQKVGPPAQLAINGSGESDASLEAENRLASQKAKGIKIVRIDTRSGHEVPVIGVSGADAVAGPYERIVQRYPDGTEVEQDAGHRALPARPTTPASKTASARPEDFLRRVQADKASVLKEGHDDLSIQNLREAYKAGQPVKPVNLWINKDGKILDSTGQGNALAAQQAGIEKIPVVVHRILSDEPVYTTGKWPSGLDPVTDKQIIGNAVAEVTGFGQARFDDLGPITKKLVIKRALDMKVEEKTSNSAKPTAVRKPMLMPSATNIVVHNGKLYHDVSDYEDGPSVFSRARYRDTDKNGTPIFDRAALKFHPDYIKEMNRAYDDHSGFRETPILRGLLRASTEAKQSLVGFLSPFHFTTEGLRGLQLGLSPHDALMPPEVTPKSLAVTSQFGPHLAIKGERSLAEEGTGQSLPIVKKIPGIGKLMDGMEKHLFGGNGYIDRLKSASFEKIVNQLSTRHPNWTTDQVHFASAKIVDAAFGGLNYKMLGWSAQNVDLLRLLMLAPDFTGSQALFAKYGFEAGGSVVGQSLMRIGLYNFVAARALNMITTGEPHFEHPFSVVSPDKKKIYSIRTMPADIAHALTDPRGFTYNRLNPLLIRTAVEGITGRDEQGKQVTYQKEFHDLLRNVMPMMLQNFVPTFRREDEGIGTGIARGFGIASEPNTTSAYQLSSKLASDRSPSGPVDQDKLEHHQHVMQMEDALRSGAIKPEALNEAIEHQTLSTDDAKKIWDNYKVTHGMDEYTARLYTRSDRLPMKDFLQVWDIATPTEKKVLLPLLEKKGKEYLKSAQKSMVQTQRDKDVTYLRVRRDLSHIPLW